MTEFRNVENGTKVERKTGSIVTRIAAAETVCIHQPYNANEGPAKFAPVNAIVEKTGARVHVRWNEKVKVIA